MSRIFTWIVSVLASVAGLFAIKKHIEKIALVRERRELGKAVTAIEKQLAKQDSRLDAQSKAKIETIRSATREILNKTSTTGSDANALISKVRGNK